MQMSFFEPIQVKQPKFELNPDGYSIKGCSIIYAPSGQAGEYARLACNPYRGCGHQCVYCFCPGVLKISREKFDSGASPRKDFLRLLQNDAVKYEAASITEQVLLSFTTDPYNPITNQLTRTVIINLQAFGLAICALTKGGSRALRDLDLFRPDRDAFASTLTSLDPDTSLLWEPKAALPQDRIDTLKKFHRAGVFTWVSLEPVIDTKTTLEIIRQTHEFVNLYKVGRINYHHLTKTTDWRKFAGDVVELLGKLGANHYVKKDLQPFLPIGYNNPLRIPQHN